MFKKLLSSLLFSCLTVLPLSGALKAIVETDDIGEIEKYRTSETLIFFDLDDVIFTTEGYLGHSEWFYRSVDKLAGLGLTWEDATEFMSDLDYEVKKVLPVKTLDPRTAGLIRNWQKNNIVVGLTSRISSLAETTFRMLDDVGVDFSSTDSLAPNINEEYSPTSRIERNVIFVSDYHSKGDIANRYLDRLSKRPLRIIFIDDKEKYLHELMEVLPDDIEFIGIRYSKEDARKALFRASYKTLADHFSTRDSR